MHLIVSVFGLMFAIAVLAGIFRTSRYSRRRRSPTSSGMPILLSYYSDSAAMAPLKEGVIGEMHYSAMAALEMMNDPSIKSGVALIYRVELPFDSSLHLLAIPKLSGVVQLDPLHGQIMERVELEGDFDDYFSLYCEKGMQLQARYVLDPSAMLCSIDFCRAKSWEIIGNELYFVQTQSDARQPMEDAVAAFVKEITPTISTPLTGEAMQQAAPYGEDRRPSLVCPVCHVSMPNKQSYYACPQCKGVLISGAQLTNLKNKSLVIPDFAKQNTPARVTPLVCPGCAATMESVQYGGVDTFIDSCPTCPYRWLDAGEVATKAPLAG